MKKLSRIYIEITNVCNLSCSFCIGNVRPAGFVTAEQFSFIAQQTKQVTDYVYFHVLGEPLLHPLLADFLAIAHATGLRVNLTTNGTLLASTQAVLLSAPALRKVSVSLHSLEGDRAMAPYLHQVAAFATAASAQGVLCDLRLWNLLAGDTENEAVFAQLCALLHLSPETRTAAALALQQSGSIQLAPKLFLGTAPRFAWPSLDAPLTNAPVFCHGLRNQAAILCDGTVVPCCLDSKGDMALGNVHQTPLCVILSSPRAQAIYDGFSRRSPVEALCRRCGYATRF